MCDVMRIAAHDAGLGLGLGLEQRRSPHPSVRRDCSCATSARTVWLATTRSGGVQRSGHVTGWPPWQTLTSGLRVKLPMHPVTKVASPHTLRACTLYFDTRVLAAARL